MLRSARSLTFKHSSFQSFGSQGFGQGKAIVMVSLAVKMHDNFWKGTVGGEVASGGGVIANPMEAALVRKLKIRLLPFLFLLFVLAFVDRINLGFAALTMNRELAITSQQFGFAAGIFFWGYFLFEVPSNLILHKIGARVWIARILMTWGTIATLTGFVHSVHQLYVARLALGIAESGYFPGIVLDLGYWFRQKEKAQAIAFILIGIPLAGILGGPISGFILDHAHWIGLSSWRFLVPFLLPSKPGEAKFLTADEKAWIAEKLEREDRLKVTGEKQSLRRTDTGEPESLACGLYRFLSRLCQLHL
jgi:MFS transporter, ACS family, tartrate transporter